MKEEILFLTHKKNKGIEQAIRLIRDQMGERSLTIISQSHSFDIEGTELFLFEESIVQEMDFPAKGSSLVPGNAHFPVFSYIKKNNSDTEYYWIIEYDVRFSGEWSVLFDHFKNFEEDLITSHIRRYNQEPGWHWWELSHPKTFIPKKDRIRSFNPIIVSLPRLSTFWNRHSNQDGKAIMRQHFLHCFIITVTGCLIFVVGMMIFPHNIPHFVSVEATLKGNYGLEP